MLHSKKRMGYGRIRQTENSVSCIRSKKTDTTQDATMRVPPPEKVEAPVTTGLWTQPKATQRIMTETF